MAAEGWHQVWLDGPTPLQFVEGILGHVPEPHQRQALIEYWEGVDGGDPAALHKIAIRSGHTQGKTRLLAWIGLHHLFCCQPCKVVATANSQDQLHDVLWSEISVVARDLPPMLREMIYMGAERIYAKHAPEDAFITARTASKDNPEALQGYHSPNLLFLIEESSGIPDIVFEVARGALSSTGSRVVMAGNPTRASGFFHRAFHAMRALWTCVHWPWVKTPYNDASYPEQMAREYGVNSNVYRIRVLGDFPTSEDNAVIPLELIESAVTREVDITARRSIVWGLDVARYGDDRCALAKRQGNYVVEKVKHWRHVDLMVTCGMVAREYFETPESKQPMAINIDVIGMGAGVVDRLSELGLPVFGVNVGETAEEPERYMRRRDELWFKVRDWLNARDVKMIDDPELISDLTAPTYKLQSNGKLLVEAKDDMKKRGVRSPDLADALGLTFAGGEYAGRHKHQAFGDDMGHTPLDAIDGQWPRRYRDADQLQTHGIDE